MFSFLEMAPRQQIYSRPGEWPYPAGLYVADLHFQKSAEINSSTRAATENTYNKLLIFTLFFAFFLEAYAK